MFILNLKDDLSDRFIRNANLVRNLTGSLLKEDVERDILWVLASIIGKILNKKSKLPYFIIINNKYNCIFLLF